MAPNDPPGFEIPEPVEEEEGPEGNVSTFVLSSAVLQCTVSLQYTHGECTHTAFMCILACRC